MGGRLWRSTSRRTKDRRLYAITMRFDLDHSRLYHFPHAPFWLLAHTLLAFTHSGAIRFLFILAPFSPNSRRSFTHASATNFGRYLLVHFVFPTTGHYLILMP